MDEQNKPNAVATASISMFIVAIIIAFLIIINM